MRLAYILVAGLLLLSSFASAGKTGGEEFLALDLSALPDGGTYFIHCSNHKATGPMDCGFVSLWQQANELDGLQTSVAFLGKQWDPDARLLG